MLDLPTLGDRVRAGRQRARLTQGALAKKVGVHLVSVARWEANALAPDEPHLERLAAVFEVPVAWLRYGETGSAAAPSELWPTAARSADDRRARSTALRVRLPLAAYAEVLQYLERLDAAGVSDDVIDEAERLLVDFAYNKLNKRDPRHRTEAELITDIRAGWAFIHEVLTRQGANLGPSGVAADTLHS